MSLQAPPLSVVRAVMPQLRFALPRFRYLVESSEVDAITSWYRDPVQNQRVGGHPQSQHLYALAVDVVTARPERVAAVARRVGLVAVIERDHVHVQAYPAGYVEREFGSRLSFW